MRTQPTGKTTGIGPASAVQLGTAAPSSSARGADHVELSALSQAATNLGPGRLEEIRTSVSSGTYDVPAAAVSRPILDFYLLPLD